MLCELFDENRIPSVHEASIEIIGKTESYQDMVEHDAPVRARHRIQFLFDGARGCPCSPGRRLAEFIRLADYVCGVDNDYEGKLLQKRPAAAARKDFAV